MPYADEDLIPISALQHHLFCSRQCALIHIDGLWAENRLTAEGQVLHARSDAPGKRKHPVPKTSSIVGGVSIVRALPLLSRRLGLVGKADQVEFTLAPCGTPVGPPRPLEHKRGKPKRLDHDRVQVAAQALCLEEMFGCKVEQGELFYHATRRRERVDIDQSLRDLVEQIACEVRANIAANRVPLAKKQPKCKNCSLLHLCMPGGIGPDRNASRYFAKAFERSITQPGTFENAQEP